MVGGVTTRGQTVADLAIGLPSLAILILGAGMLLLTMFGVGPLIAPELSLPEAALMRDPAEVLRQIRSGVDPNLPLTVRSRFLVGTQVPGRDRRMTPLEAAIGVRREDVVRLLVRNGAAVTSANLPRLSCFAERMGSPEIVAFLQTAVSHPDAAPHPDVAIDCAGVATPW
jgi:hypothetical protein